MNLYFRLLRVLLRLIFTARRPLLTPARLRLRVWPSDCDLNFHMNNGRYLTLMDLGRIDLLGRAGLLPRLMRRRWMPVLGAAEISFIRPLNPFQRFDLVTRIIGWDEKYFYIEQRFESGSHLYAVAHVRGLFVSERRPVSMPNVVALADTSAVPDLPPLMRDWNALLAHKRHVTGKPHA